MSFFIDVIIPIPLERLFTYSITQAESKFLKPGMRVAVPFGKNKIYTGLVYEIHTRPPLQYDAKDIHQILDDKPIVTQSQLELWDWISEYYMCTLGDLLRASLPSILLLESETIIQKTEHETDETDLNDEEFMVYEALGHQSILKVEEVSDILGRKKVLPVLKSLIDKNVLNLKEEIYEQYKPKKLRYVRLSERYHEQSELEDLIDTLSRAPKQRAILLSYYQLKGLKEGELIQTSELLKSSRASSAQLKALIDKSIFEEHYLTTDRVNIQSADSALEISLSEDQSRALNEINQQFLKQNVSLLHGVTSSGKTEVYIELIKSFLARGNQVLYLVPEIALTTQLVNRLQAHFEFQVAVFHSRYSMAERVEVMHHVLNHSEKGQLILGARSAVLLPFQDLGLIVVDEEHEPSYKQFDPAPRYHARDVAIMLGAKKNAKVLLGSATPSIETFYNARELKKYGLVELNNRYNDVLPPDINLIDLKEAYRRKQMSGHFSSILKEAIAEVLSDNGQVILFQNRRGFAPIIYCQTCGHSPQCPNCDVSLSYHQFREQLRCHYCAHSIPMPKQCIACGSVELNSRGFGTEQVEEEIKALFPEAKVGRLDYDSTRGKYAYQKIIGSFEKQEINILVGTQMITKGLDFRQVKLVGIMLADSLLNFPDFRAHERSFQLMQQVAGRAGRTDLRGKVLIQTYNPYHKILQQVSTHDYRAMYEEQLQERYQYKYPPYFRLIKITLKHKDFNKLNQGAEWLSKSLRNTFGSYVLGPEFPVIARVRNQYHKNILIKIPQGQALGKTKEAVLRIKNSFLSIKDFRPIRVILNVDNY